MLHPKMMKSLLVCLQLWIFTYGMVNINITVNNVTFTTVYEICKWQVSQNVMNCTFVAPHKVNKMAGLPSLTDL